jgi:acyl-CoA thioesterase-2
MSFASLMALQDHGQDRYSGAGGRYPWEWLYGGEVVAQALRAAAATVAPDHAFQSMHTYFVRSGDHGGVDLAVRRLRDGRAFSVRSIVASQAGRVVATASASFHTHEADEDTQLLTAPAVPPPETLESSTWSQLFDHRYPPTPDPARLLAWVRMTEPLDDEPVLHACALAYCIDDLFDTPVLRMLGFADWLPEGFSSTDGIIASHSLEFSLWLHRPVSADEWLLLDNRCTSLANACATVTGQVFDCAGRHVATVAQQVLARRSQEA